MNYALISLSLLHAVLYVACIYAAVAISPLEHSSRDHPLVIRRRMRGALAATLASLVITALALRPLGWVEQLGLSPHAAGGSLGVGLFLTLLLYLGPLWVGHLDGAFAWEHVRHSLRQAVGDPACWRNYAVGPLTEELVFRAATVPLWLASGLSPLVCVAVSPLVFAVAHVHHAVAAWCGGEALPRVLGRMAVQLAYTSVFGCYAAALFVRTRSVAGSVAAHVVCNLMGLPSVERIAEQGKYKYALWVAHVVGLLGMVLLFEPMTRPGVFV
ncbi:CAAX prenyl protease [Coemansia furcata]|nr:CAAX prenyl protease [Coemansia furcata]